MKVRDLAERLGIDVVAGEKGLDREVKDGYCGDLLSDVMGNAPVESVWLTVQGHQNIVAVAVLREITGIVLTGGQKPEEAAKTRADEEGIPILLWEKSTYELAGKLYSAGVGAMGAEKV